MYIAFKYPQNEQKRKSLFCMDRYKSYVNKVELIVLLKNNGTNSNPNTTPKL